MIKKNSTYYINRNKRISTVILREIFNSFSIVFIFSVVVSNILTALPYYNGAAIRIEMGKDCNSGIGFKHFTSEDLAIEGLLLTDMKKGAEVTGLLEYHSIIPGTPPEVNWFAGAGAHIGSWGKDDNIVLGLDGILGIEYTFTDLPIAISADWHPVANLYSKNDEKMWPMKFGISIRYIF